MKVHVKCVESHWYWELFFWLWAKVIGVKRLYGFATAWHTVIVRRNRLDDVTLLAHELTHIRQVEEMGFWRFAWEYVKELRLNGYRNNRFELEAREASLSPEYTMSRFTIHKDDR